MKLKETKKDARKIVETWLGSKIKYSKQELESFFSYCQDVLEQTQYTVEEDAEQKQKRIEKLKNNYGQFVEYYFPHLADSECAWYHTKAAKTLSASDFVQLIWEGFRGSAKSVHANICIPMFLKVRGELSYMLLVGETEKKANRLISDIQVEFEYNQRIINDFGAQSVHGDWSSGEFQTADGTFFTAIGLGQNPRGLRKRQFRPDYISCDDLDNKRRCNNPRLVREAVEWITDDLMQCFSAKRRKFVLLNNRIHKNSILTGVLKALPACTHLRINATKKPWGSPDNESNWGARLPMSHWERLFDTEQMPYRTREREYFNNPIEDGKVFKAEWIQYKKMLPLSKYDALVVYGDLSYKDNGDYKSLKLWGKIGREFHRIAVLCRQTSRAMCAEWLYNLYEDLRLEKYNVAYYIEGLFAMDEFVNDFDLEGDKRKYYIPVQADTRPKAAKFDRIEQISGFWERRNVWYNIDTKDSADEIAELDQTLAFERGSGANDDAPDADAGAIGKLNTQTFVNESEMRTGKRPKPSSNY